MCPPARRGTATTACAPGTSALFEAFPDNHFDLIDIVVGPQGVFEVARLTATNTGPWGGAPASGLPVDLEVLILFPFDPVARLFTGERIWLNGSALPNL